MMASVKRRQVSYSIAITTTASIKVLLLLESNECLIFITFDAPPLYFQEKIALILNRQRSPFFSFYIST